METPNVVKWCTFYQNSRLKLLTIFKNSGVSLFEMELTKTDVRYGNWSTKYIQILFFKGLRFNSAYYSFTYLIEKAYIQKYNLRVQFTNKIKPVCCDHHKTLFYITQLYLFTI